MLSLNDRLRYLHALRPPEGYRLDSAVATTFSVDLLTLLITPLAMVLFETENADKALRDPTAVLEAVRRTRDKLTVFCQAGRIAPPTMQHRLFAFLEPVVVEVNAPKAEGVFHPKIWVLRFVNEDGDVTYRFLCLSRNLTFDRSWDTLLVLEGPLLNRSNAIARNHALGDFISHLPGLAITPMGKRRKDVERIAHEVKRVKFELPQGFADLTFQPSGIPDLHMPPKFGRHSRLLVVSPFLTDDTLTDLLKDGTGNVLISRPDSLDALKPATRKALAGRVQSYTLHEQAEAPEETAEERAEQLSVQGSEDLSGLHAKLYIAEHGWDAYVVTGSANATEPAFDGKNVEFTVELKGLKSKVGIDRFLGDEKDRYAFGRLLEKYELAAEPPKQDEARRQAEWQMELARRYIARLQLKGQLKAKDDNTFSFHVSGKGNKKPPSGLRITCRPMMLSEEFFQNAEAAWQKGDVQWKAVSLESLSSFMVFRVEHEATKAKILFSRNIPVSGMPEDREQRILRSIISDRGRFLRYLLFLLSDDPEQLVFSGILAATADGGAGDDAAPFPVDLPLFEELVRAFSRQPEKLNHVREVVADLVAGGDVTDILPEGFMDLWASFDEALGGSK